MLMATHTTAPTVTAATMPSGPVHPMRRKTRLVASSVPIVMPDTGLDELPTMPTIRDGDDDEEEAEDAR